MRTRFEAAIAVCDRLGWRLTDLNLEIAEAQLAAVVDGNALTMRLRGARELALSLVVALDMDLELESKPTPEGLRYTATAAERARLDALVTKPVRKALGAFKNEVVKVTDTVITVRYNLGRELDDAGAEAVFEELVRRAIKLAFALDRAAASVPVAAALTSVVPALQGLAETHGGTLRSAPLALSGHAGGIRYALRFSLQERFDAEGAFPVGHSGDHLDEAATDRDVVEALLQRRTHVRR